MRKTVTWLLAVVLTVGTMGCRSAAEKEDAASYLDEVMQRTEDGFEWGDKVDFGVPYCYAKGAEESTEDGWTGEETINAENAYSFRIDWLKADGNILLTDMNFDMKDYLTEADSTTAFVRGVFFDRETKKIYIPVSAVDRAYTWLVEVSTDKTAEYTVTGFAGEGNWFGECYRLEDEIYLNGGAGDIPVAINTVTLKLHTCTQEYEAAVQVMQDWIKENSPSYENAQIFWFWAMDEAPDEALSIMQSSRRTWIRTPC